jgi:glutamine synthetase
MQLITYCNQLGYGVYQNDHEDANGQFEINWRFADALKQPINSRFLNS